MPKVILGEQNKREEALRAYINEKKGEGRLYRTGGDFAENAMGVTPESFSKWKKRGFPAFFQTLCRMFQKTHITDRQLCLIFGVEYKGRTKDDCYDR